MNHPAMEGVGSVADAAAAAMGQIKGVTRSDVVEELGGCHGGGGGGMASLVGLVTEAPNLEETADAAGGQAEGMDLDMQVTAVEDLVVQPQEVAVMEFGVTSHFTVGYDGSDEEYFSEYEVEVEPWNYKSFVKKEEKKQRMQGLAAYLPYGFGRYMCPFHHNKPRNGERVGLVEHVRRFTTPGCGKDMRDEGKYEALLRVLEPDEFGYVDSETEE